jgi:DNA-binding response OmpR family regulator
MKKQEILIVDDDKDLAMITGDMLEDYGYQVQMTTSAEEAYDLLSNRQFKLILLDINLPGETGFDFCLQVRKNSTIPVIFVSASTSETDRVKGLDIGADDYLLKPYSLQELLSRINANIRRAYGYIKEKQLMKCVDLTIDMTARTVSRDEKNINLSLKEFDLLIYLIIHRNTVIKKEELLSEIWGIFSEVEISTVAVHIRWLREKLEKNPSEPKMIRTVWGVGYILIDGEDADEE